MSTSNSPQPQRATILIVDDDTMMRTLFRVMLTNVNSRILEAGTGRQAIEIATAEQPDVILLDAMLPDLNGFEVCAHLRQSSGYTAGRIVMVTALNTQQAHDRAIAAGADEFWGKPVSSQALRSGVLRMLSSNHRALCLAPE